MLRIEYKLGDVFMYDVQIMLVANSINEDVNEPDIYSAPFDEAHVPKIAAVIGLMISRGMLGFRFDDASNTPSIRELVLQFINYKFKDPKTRKIAYLILNKLLSNVKEVITPSSGEPPNVGRLKRVTKDDPQYDDKKIAYYRNTVSYWVNTFNSANPPILKVGDNESIPERDIDYFLGTNKPKTGALLLKGYGFPARGIYVGGDDSQEVWLAKDVKEFVKTVRKLVASLTEKIYVYEQSRNN